jgi:hypothetical protein
MTNEECRIEDYIVPECDRDGKSWSICFRIPPELSCEVNRVASSGEFPFEARQDLFRWAFHGGIRSLADMRNTPPVQIWKLPFLALEKEWPDKNWTFFHKLEETVFQLRALGFGPRRLRRFADAIEELIHCMPATHHRSSYLTRVKRTWRFYLVSSAELRERRYGS